MANKTKARLLVKEYLENSGTPMLSECDSQLEALATLSPQVFQNTTLPPALLDDSYYFGTTASAYKKSTDVGIPLELFSDFCHSFVFCFTEATKEEIEQGHDTFLNYKLIQKREVSPRELCTNLPHGVGIEDDFYIVWTIYKRNDDAPADFGPKYFSVLAMNGDILGNYGVIFHLGQHKPLCISLPDWGLSWSNKTWQMCDHRPPTREVVRHQFVPQATRLVDMFFTHSQYGPDFLLSLRPFENFGFPDDDFGSTAFYANFMKNFPNAVLEIPANLCRNGAQGNIVMYKGK